MFIGEWVGPVLASIGLIVILAALELLSIAIADIADTGKIATPVVDRKRAA